MEVSRARYRFGAVSRASAEAIGVPGERTFRLALESGAASASVWLEKEQLYHLAIYIQEIIGSLSSSAKAKEGEAPEPQWSGQITTVEAAVAKLSLGHDASSSHILFLIYDAGEPEDGAATLSFWLSLSQSEELAKEAVTVCAAGRPRCFLCGQPINPDGHMCPRANGHGPLEA